MKIGFSGHQNAPEHAMRFLRGAVHELVTAEPDSIGITSLAAGADQTFAQVVLDSGGQLHAVLPCEGYDRTFSTTTDLCLYTSLLERSSTVTNLPFPEAKEEAFLAAGIVVCERCDILLALWDGEPAAGLGGTADIVSYADAIGRNTKIIWPPGLSR